MKQIFVVVVALMLPVMMLAQAGVNLEIEKYYGAKKDEVAKRIVLVGTENYAIVGRTKSVGEGKNDFWVVRTTNSGVTLWEKSFGGKSDDEARSAAATPDGGLIVVGYTESKGSGGRDMWVVKLDQKGNKLWDATFGGTGDDIATDVAVYENGDILVSGNNAIGSSIAARLVRLNEFGSVIWNKIYGTSGINKVNSIAISKNGNCYIAGATPSSVKSKDANLWLFMIDETGLVKWTQTSGNAELSESASSIAIDYDNNLIIAGQIVRYRGSSISSNNLWVLKYNQSGEQLWTSFTKQDNEFLANSIIATPDGKYLVSTRGMDKKPIINKLSDFGDINWSLPVSHNDEDIVFDLTIGYDGSYLVTGAIKSKGAGGIDFWLQKVKDAAAIEAMEDMVRRSQITVIDGISTVMVDSAFTAFKPFAFDFTKDALDYYAEIVSYVNEKMEEWEQQDKFELPEEYFSRLTLINAKKEDEKYTRMAMRQFAGELVDLKNLKYDNNYDVVKESYTILSENEFPMKLSVPRELARDGLIENFWDTRRIKNPVFTFWNNIVVLYAADFEINGQVLKYKASKIESYGNDLALTVNRYDEKAIIMAEFYSETVRYVQDKMNTWKKKDEFESMDVFRERTSDTGIYVQENIFSKSALSAYAPQKINIDYTDIGSYESTYERFSVKVPGSIEAYVDVPSNLAPTFKENFDNYEFSNVEYGYYDNNYVLYSAEIHTRPENTLTGDTASFDENGERISIDSASIYVMTTTKHPLLGNRVKKEIHLKDMDFNRLDAYTYKSIFPNKQRTSNPPVLLVTNVKFTDSDQNSRLDAGEAGKISFVVMNTGKGAAFNTSLNIYETTGIKGLVYDQKLELGDIQPGENKAITINVSANSTISTVLSKFIFRMTESGGNNPDDVAFSLQTYEYVAPELKVSRHLFAIENGGLIESGKAVHLKLTINNEGMGTAKDIKATFSLPAGIVEDNLTEPAVMLASGETTTLDFVFRPTSRFNQPKVSITVLINGNSGNLINQEFTVSMDEELVPQTHYDLLSDVDLNVPEFDPSKVKTNRYAIIFGNEDYKSYQRSLKEEANVDYAAGDALMFRNYARNVMGIQNENIRFKVNAKKEDMTKMIDEILLLAKNNLGGEAEVFLYYAGHGFPDEKTNEAYIMPVDVAGSEVVQRGINSGELYKKLTSAPNVGKVTVFMDACFSGGGREEGLLAARAVKVKPVESPMINGKFVLFAAASGDQTALPYEAKNHGIFTYFLLKKLKETQGNVDYNELSQYIKDNVSSASPRVNNKKEQNPKVSKSPSAVDWLQWRIND